MRTAITLVRRHGSREFAMEIGPDVALLDHVQNFREGLGVAAAGPHPEIAELQLWVSDSGLERSVKFLAPEEYAARNTRREADEQAHQAHQAKNGGERTKPVQPAAKAKAPSSRPRHD